ncbi:hypothetical protein ACWEKM_13400 [Streptomyces sp. NPDC004752]
MLVQPRQDPIDLAGIEVVADAIEDYMPQLVRSAGAGVCRGAAVDALGGSLRGAQGVTAAEGDQDLRTCSHRPGQERAAPGRDAVALALVTGLTW